MFRLIYCSLIQPARLVPAGSAPKKIALKSFKFRTLWLLLCPPKNSVRHLIFGNYFRELSQNQLATSKDVFARLMAGNTNN